MRRVLLLPLALIVCTCALELPEESFAGSIVESARVEAYSVEIEKTRSGESTDHTDEWAIHRTGEESVEYVSFASDLDLSQLRPEDGTRLMLPPLEDAEAIEGTIIDRTWTIDGRGWNRSIDYPDRLLDERIEVTSCANLVCEIIWRRDGSYEDFGAQQALEQSGTGRYDVARRIYMNAESTLRITSRRETRITAYSLTYDPIQSKLLMRERLAIARAEEAGGAELDAWVADNPPEAEARRAIVETQESLDYLLEEFGRACNFDSSVVAFYAVAQPETAWDVAFELPPGTGTGSAISTIWSTQRREGIPVSDQHIERLIQLGRDHEEIRLEVSKVADPRLREELQRLAREDGDNHIRELATESLGVLDGTVARPSAALGAFFIPNDELGSLADALNQLEVAAPNEQHLALRRLRQLTFHGFGVELDSWRAFADEHGHQSRQQWALLALESESVWSRHRGAAGLSDFAPFEQGTAALLRASQSPNPQLRYHAARSLLAWRDLRGAQPLVSLLGLRGANFPDSDVIQPLAPLSLTTFGLHRHHSRDAARAAAVGRWREWARRVTPQSAGDVRPSAD